MKPWVTSPCSFLQPYSVCLSNHQTHSCPRAFAQTGLLLHGASLPDISMALHPCRQASVQSSLRPRSPEGLSPSVPLDAPLGSSWLSSEITAQGSLLIAPLPSHESWPTHYLLHLFRVSLAPWMLQVTGHSRSQADPCMQDFTIAHKTSWFRYCYSSHCVRLGN